MSIGLLKNIVNDNASKEEQLKSLGLNSGNLVFWKSLQRLFNPTIIPYSSLSNIKKMDKMIITDLIWIRENSDYNYLEDIIDNYQIPFIPISIGLQCENYKPNFKLSNNTVRLLKKLEERAVLGLRGEYTADILDKYGIKNISIIGCPSMYFWNNPNLTIADNITPKNCISNFKTFYGKLNIPQKQFLSYCAQKKMTFIEQTSWPFTLETACNDKAYFNFVNKWLQNNLIIPTNYEEWCKILSNKDFSIGGRFHGNVIALWNNIKSLFLVSDSRTQELTDYFHLPTLKLNDFDSAKPLQYYYELADYSLFNKNYPIVYNNFLDFISKNNLTTYLCSKPLYFGKEFAAYNDYILNNTNKQIFPNSSDKFDILYSEITRLKDMIAELNQKIDSFEK